MTVPPVTELVTIFGDVLLTWGWLFVVFLALWIAWESYKLLKHIDYVAGIQWTFLQINVTDESAQTPKAFENCIEVIGGMHKDPDIIERLFEGYFLPWFSCEIQCSKDRTRYIMVVPTPHRKLIEGVIYGQYPMVEIKEVEDYTLEFDYRDIGKKFEMWGSEIVNVDEDYMPIRTYHEFEDTLAEDDRFIDPHQALVEAFTHINEGEHFWVQVLIKPVAAGTISAWADAGQEAIAELSGQKIEVEESIFKKAAGLFTSVPGEIMSAALSGPAEAAEAENEPLRLKFPNPAEDAAMKGILMKVARNGYKTKIRVMHFAPLGKLHKPNYGKAIGAFKQFNSFNLNSLKPDGLTKTNGPNYILKQTRRAYRMRSILLNYQWRDFWGDDSGFMMSAEELATLYHFPVKYVRSPSVERAAAGVGAPPANVPYA
ncbi:hypothetical protein CL628_01345 [bacterium]|nr:hypothetical protein [bacterium]